MSSSQTRHYLHNIVVRITSTLLSALTKDSIKEYSIIPFLRADVYAGEPKERYRDLLLDLESPIAVEVKVHKSPSKKDIEGHTYQLLSYVEAYRALLIKTRKEYVPVTGILLYISNEPKLGLQAKDEHCTPIYLINGPSNSIFDIFLPMNTKPSQENLNKALEMLDKLVSRVSSEGDRGEIMLVRLALSELDSSLDFVMDLASSELEVDEYLQKDEEIRKLREFIRRMSSMLERYSPLQPIRAVFLLKREPNIDKKKLLDAIKRKVVLIMEPEDVEALVKYGKLTKEELLELIPRKRDLLVALYQEGIISKEDLLTLIPRDVRLIRKLYEEDIITREEYEALKEEILRELRD